jgi:lysozyme
MNLELAAAMCRRFEGLSLVPYICPAGYPTLGYGTVFKPDGTKVTMTDAPISKETAEDWLMHELKHTYAAGVMRLCPGLANEERIFNAVVDFTYNLGVGRLQTSTLRRKINAQDWEGAKEQLMLWTRGGGRVLPGLVRRRQAEVALLPSERSS